MCFCDLANYIGRPPCVVWCVVWCGVVCGVVWTLDSL